MKMIKEILRLHATKDLHLRSSILDEISAQMITKGKLCWHFTPEENVALTVNGNKHRYS